jgi:hypothetical protein
MPDISFTVEMRDDGSVVLKNLKRTAEEAGTGVEGAMKRASSGVEGLNAKTVTAARAIGGMVGIGSIAALAAFARNAFNAADSLTDLADQSGHSVRMLLSLEQVTARYGVSLEEVTRSTQFMLRSLVTAQEGANAQSEAMKKLGFSTRDALRFMSDPDGFLREFAKRLAALPSHAERLAVAQDLASRAGGRLAPVLLDIAQNGLPEVSAETERAYKVLGEFADWLAVQAVKKVQAFNTAIVDMAKTLGLISKGPEDRLAALDRQIEILRQRAQHPYHAGRIGEEIKLQGLIRDRIDLEEQLERMQAPAATTVTPTTATGLDPKKIGSVAESLQKQIIGLQGQKIALEQGETAALRFKLTQEALAQLNAKTLPASVRTLIDSIVAEAAALEQAKFEQERLDEVTRRYDQDLADMKITAEETYEKILRPAEIERTRLQLEALAQSWNALDALDAERGKDIEGLKRRTDEFATTLARLNEEERNAGTLSAALGDRFDLTSTLIDVQRQRVAALAKEYGALSPKVKEAVAELSRLEEVEGIKKFFSGIGDAISRGVSETLSGVIQGTQTMTEAIRNMGRNILIAINDAIVQALVIEPIKKHINAFAAGFAEAFAEGGESASEKIARDFGRKLGGALRMALGGESGESGVNIQNFPNVAAPVAGAASANSDNWTFDVQAGFEQLNESVSNGLSNLFSVSSSGFTNFFAQLGGFFTQGISSLASGFTGIMGTLLSSIGSGLSWLIELIGSVLSSIGGGLGGLGGSIGSFLGDLIFGSFHQGGLVQRYHAGGLVAAAALAATLAATLPVAAPRMHGGGLAPDEVPLIAQTGEMIIKRPAVQSIGSSALEQMNRTGKFPREGQEPKVDVKVQINGDIIPRGPWTTPEDVVKVVFKSIRDQTGVYVGMREYGPGRYRG